MTLSPLLQREIDAIVTKLAREKLLTELAGVQKDYYHFKREGNESAANFAHNVELYLALMIPRLFPLADAQCLRCGETVKEGDDFCQSCQEQLEDGEQVRRYW